MWGTDDDFFVDFFTRHSFASLQAIDKAYQAKYKHSLEVAVKKETSGMCERECFPSTFNYLLYYFYIHILFLIYF